MRAIDQIRGRRRRGVTRGGEEVRGREGERDESCEASLWPGCRGEKERMYRRRKCRLNENRKL